MDAVITGAVLRAGDRVRITAQLINAATEEHLWADRYERELRDVLSLQNKIVAAITREINLQLTPQEQTRLASTRPVNPEAYEAYLKGRFHREKFTPQDFEIAMNYFQRALEKDPNYALAYTGIASVWGSRQQMGFVPTHEAGPRMKAAVLKALELDSTLAEVHHRLAGVRVWTDWDWEGGEAEFRRAIEINPNYAGAHSAYSHLLMIMRRPEEAMAQIERAMELDPHNPQYQAFYGGVLELLRRYDDAIVQYRNALRTTPNLTFAQTGLWRVFHLKGMYAEALEEAKKSYADDHEVEEALDRGYAQGGYQGAMRRAAETLAARSHTTFVPPLGVARLYRFAGDNDRALEWLEKGYEKRSPTMPYLGAAEFDSHRDDPRFQDLLRRMNLPE